jgi:hypothetical protein
MDKYTKNKINTGLVLNDFHTIEAYEEALRFYLQDDFFDELKGFLDNNDFEMAKDALKGLYILAGDLKLFPLYESLLEIYQDLLEEEYRYLGERYETMKAIHDALLEDFLK